MTTFDSSGRSTHFPQPFGKYTLLSRLATGGMAYVYLARQEGVAGFEKECVIKRILPHLSEDQTFVHMFLDEARLAARLSHPNIVQIFDLGQTEGNYYIAMEYVNGVDLGKLLHRAKEHGDPAVPWQVATRIIADAAAGLAHAHQATDPQGAPLCVVHRDISPTNIMVSRAGIAKVLDFGIASAVAKESQTTVGTIKGRLSYMSPEQLQGHTLDGRADLFSLAVVFYELVYGVRPFVADSMGALTLQILQQEPVPPTTFANKIPARLQMILSRALSKRPEDRWQHMRVFQRALEQLLTEQHADCTSYHVQDYLKQLFPETNHVSSLPASVVPQMVSIAPPPAHVQKATARSFQPTLLQRRWGVFATVGVALVACSLLFWQHPWHSSSPTQQSLNHSTPSSPTTSAIASTTSPLTHPLQPLVPGRMPSLNNIAFPFLHQTPAYPMVLRTTGSSKTAAPAQSSKLSKRLPESTLGYPSGNKKPSPPSPSVSQEPKNPKVVPPSSLSQPDPPVAKPPVEPPVVEPPVEPPAAKPLAPQESPPPSPAAVTVDT